MPLSSEALSRAIRGDDGAVRLLVKALSPIVQVRVGRALMRHRKAMSAQQVRQETEDLCQETFALLFADQARVLRGWDEHKGLSLQNFVGLIAERVAFSWLRTGRKNAWRELPMEGNDLMRSADRAAESELDNLAMARGATSPESQVATRETLERVVERLKVELPPNGYQVFYLVYVAGKSSREVCEIMGLKPDTVYSWRSRLMKRARAILSEISAEVVQDAAGVAG